MNHPSLILVVGVTGAVGPLMCRLEARKVIEAIHIVIGQYQGEVAIQDG